MLRLRGSATAFKPARAGIKRIGRLAAIMGKRPLKSDYKPLSDNVNTKYPGSEQKVMLFEK